MANCLVLEDERIVKNLVALILRQNGHSVRQAGTPEDAGAICQEHPVDVLVADVNLSDGCSGAECAVRIVRAHPRIKCLFISGVRIENWTQADHDNLKDMPEGYYAALRKPFAPEVLLKAIDDLLAPHPGTLVRDELPLS